MSEEPTQTGSSSSVKRKFSRSYPFVLIGGEMIAAAQKLIPTTKVNRTVASKIDTLSGHLGEFAFAQYFYGDWRENRVGKNRGQPDFPDVEIKTSAFPFSENLNLLVREDYAKKRKPRYYVQIILNVPSRYAEKIKPNVKAVICGYATSGEVDAAPKRDFGSKISGKGGYLCYYIPIINLHPIRELKSILPQAISK